MAIGAQPKTKIKDLTKIQTPHTYVIIFWVVIVLWLATFIIPAGKFSTHEIKYSDSNGEIKTRTVLMPETFRYEYNLDMKKLLPKLQELSQNEAKLKELGIDKVKLDEFLNTDPSTWDQKTLDSLGLTDSLIYSQFKESVYDTSKKIYKHARLWGTDDFGGFGVLNYVFEGLVTGDKYGSAVGIVALLLVVGGAFNIIIKTGAIDAGIHAFVSNARGYESIALLILFFIFSLGGAVYGMSEECIPLAAVMVPFVIALGYDSITAVCVTFVASQVGNAGSWMNPFGVAIAQGIAGIPLLSGAPFRLVLWLVVTSAGAAYVYLYGTKIKKNPEISIMYESDNYFREKLKQGETEEVKMEFNLGHKLVLLTMFLGVIWIIWGVVVKKYYIPEIASQFFVMGFVSGIIGVIFKLNNMTSNDIATSFGKGAADLASTAVVVGMAKGLLLVLGGSDPTTPTALNTILHGFGEAIKGLPSVITGLFMYLFQSVFDLFVTSNSGQAALTMPIMAPLADIVGLSRQIACLAYQLGSGFVDAIAPTSASLIGVLAIARIDWFKWAKWHIKMQGFFFVIGSIFMIIAVLINFS
ncbi:MAG TPA: putative basic amino acid antiporter YfcC [Thermoanaerobacterales bacterium]|nr:putative basic amino acid antiporter YfcC [Thermoanaerobacterales bacterium]